MRQPPEGGMALGHTHRKAMLLFQTGTPRGKKYLQTEVNGSLPWAQRICSVEAPLSFSLSWSGQENQSRQRLPESKGWGHLAQPVRNFFSIVLSIQNHPPLKLPEVDPGRCREAEEIPDLTLQGEKESGEGDLGLELAGGFAFHAEAAYGCLVRASVCWAGGGSLLWNSMQGRSPSGVFYEKLLQKHFAFSPPPRCNKPFLLSSAFQPRF